MHRSPSLRARARATAIAAAATGMLALALAIAGGVHARPAQPEACRMRDIPAGDVGARARRPSAPAIDPRSLRAAACRDVDRGRR
jgi:hypothetical protein